MASTPRQFDSPRRIDFHTPVMGKMLCASSATAVESLNSIKGNVMFTHLVGSVSPSKFSITRALWVRRDRRHLLVILAVGLLSVGQAAAQEAGAPASTQATPAPGKSGKVCRYEDVTGSRMKKRICYTPEQWEARERAAKELVRELDGKSIPRDGSGG